jgi:hypothetical protein
MTVAAAIRAEITGSDTATAAGITVRAEAPVLELCRKLIEAGHDPQVRLEAYRGETLCLIVRSIGEGSRLEIGKAGFRRRSAGAGASPMRRSVCPGERVTAPNDRRKP